MFERVRLGFRQFAAKVWAASLCMALAGACNADWEVLALTLPGAQAPTKAASVVNESGYTLSIALVDEREVRGLLTLPPRFMALAADGCPTIVVDDFPPLALTGGDVACFSAPRQAWFRLAEVNNNRAPSSLLFRLMNGIRLEFRLRLSGTGYVATEFSLSGSKQALNAALGNLRVVEN